MAELYSIAGCLDINGPGPNSDFYNFYSAHNIVKFIVAGRGANAGGDNARSSHV
ncbi:hypothetical protein DSUL_150099 [Desulfovibrionales bacterium]